jgi:hypothetical protein
VQLASGLASVLVASTTTSSVDVGCAGSVSVGSVWISWVSVGWGGTVEVDTGAPEMLQERINNAASKDKVIRWEDIFWFITALR